jgi:hypothetical protein
LRPPPRSTHSPVTPLLAGRESSGYEGVYGGDFRTKARVQKPSPVMSENQFCSGLLGGASAIAVPVRTNEALPGLLPPEPEPMDLMKIPGASEIREVSVAPGPPGVYAYVRETQQRNLFRIRLPLKACHLSRCSREPAMTPPRSEHDGKSLDITCRYRHLVYFFRPFWFLSGRLVRSCVCHAANHARRA